MVVFNVYEPPQTSGDRMDRAERLAFIKDGFHWMAALFPVFWLPIKGLWLELVVFLVGMGVIIGVLEAVGVNNQVVSALALIVQILIGFEATNIQGAALERRGWRPAGSVAGRSREECEVRFLAAWLQEQPQYAPLALPGSGSATFDAGGMPSAEDAYVAGERPASWLGGAWYDVKESLARGRRLART